MKIVNRKARYRYQILDEIEAGIALTGSEVKSLREGRGSLLEAFSRIKDGEVWLHNFVIPLYSHASPSGYDPARPRKLLLHKNEILALSQKMSSGGLGLVPLACYFSQGFVKVRLGLARGMKQYEKRETIKRREQEREAARAIKLRS